MAAFRDKPDFQINYILLDCTNRQEVLNPDCTKIFPYVACFTFRLYTNNINKGFERQPSQGILIRDQNRPLKGQIQGSLISPLKPRNNFQVTH